MLSPSSTTAGRGSSGKGAWLASFIAGMLLTSQTFLQQASAQATISAEYRSEANALSKIPSFVEWPESAFASAKDPFRLCVYGNFSFGTALSEFTRTDVAHGRRVDIRWAHKESELRSCQIVFISRSEQKNYAKVIASLRGTATLTVGETIDFAESGGMIEFLYDNGALTFEVNLAPAEEAHLKINSRLLSLARRVLRPAETAKS